VPVSPELDAILCESPRRRAVGGAEPATPRWRGPPHSQYITDPLAAVNPIDPVGRSAAVAVALGKQPESQCSRSLRLNVYWRCRRDRRARATSS